MLPTPPFVLQGSYAGGGGGRPASIPSRNPAKDRQRPLPSPPRPLEGRGGSSRQVDTPPRPQASRVAGIKRDWGGVSPHDLPGDAPGGDSLPSPQSRPKPGVPPPRDAPWNLVPGWVACVETGGGEGGESNPPCPGFHASCEGDLRRGSGGGDNNLRLLTSLQGGVHVFLNAPGKKRRGAAICMGSWGVVSRLGMLGFGVLASQQRGGPEVSEVKNNKNRTHRGRLTWSWV